MKILKWKPMDAKPSARGFRPLGCFTLEILPGVVVFNCVAVEAPDGRLIIYGPKDMEDSMAVSFSPKIREEIADAVGKTVGIIDHDALASAA